MKTQNPTLKQKIFDLLSATDKPMRCGEIASHVSVQGRIVSSTLRHMLLEGEYPKLRRIGAMHKFRYIANDKAGPAPAKKVKRPPRPQHPIMADLWRGWGDAPMLGKGESTLVEEVNREP